MAGNIKRMICRPYHKDGENHIEFIFEHDDATRGRIDVIFKEQTVTHSGTVPGDVIECRVYRRASTQKLMVSIDVLSRYNVIQHFEEEFQNGPFIFHFGTAGLN